MALKRPERKHIVITLKEPVEIDGERAECIFMMHPRGLELRLLPAPSEGSKLLVADYEPFAAKICGVAVDDLWKLETADYGAVMQAAIKMQAEVPKDGQKNAPGSAASSTSGAMKS